MDYTIFDFTEAYCSLYNVCEDELDGDDINYIDTSWWVYCQYGNLPDFMEPTLTIME